MGQHFFSFFFFFFLHLFLSLYQNNEWDFFFFNFQVWSQTWNYYDRSDGCGAKKLTSDLWNTSQCDTKEPGDLGTDDPPPPHVPPYSPPPSCGSSQFRSEGRFLPWTTASSLSCGPTWKTTQYKQKSSCQQSTTDWNLNVLTNDKPLQFKFSGLGKL